MHDHRQSERQQFAQYVAIASLPRIVTTTIRTLVVQRVPVRNYLGNGCDDSTSQAATANDKIAEAIQ